MDLVVGTIWSLGPSTLGLGVPLPSGSSPLPPVNSSPSLLLSSNSSNSRLLSVPWEEIGFSFSDNFGLAQSPSKCERTCTFAQKPMLCVQTVYCTLCKRVFNIQTSVTWFKACEKKNPKAISTGCHTHIQAEDSKVPHYSRSLQKRAFHHNVKILPQEPF